MKKLVSRKLLSLSVVAILVFSMGMLVSGGNINVMEQHIYSCNTNTLGDWHVYPGDSIQDAVDSASDGDTIYVHAGTYVENVDVDKKLNLIGDGMNEVTVEAEDTGDHTFYLTADEITIDGFTVMNSRLCGYGGICIEGADNCEIHDNKCTENLCAGIFLINADHCKIKNNVVSNNDCGGIKLTDHSDHNTIAGNTVEHTENWGMNIYGESNNNLIYNNYFAGHAGVNLVEDHGTNTWNTEKTPGENIIGGPYLGGNYYDLYEGSDSDEDGIGDTPYQIPGGSNIDYLPLVQVSGHPPNTPSTPDGPTSGKAGTSYKYSTSTTDPDGDQVKYGWDWNGDKVADEWTTFYESGETCETSHTWTEKGTYDIRVKAQDKGGLESEWSNPLSVSMPKNKKAPVIKHYQCFPLFNRLLSQIRCNIVYNSLSKALTTTVNLPPPVPTVTGPTEGDVGVEYTFCAVATFGCSNVDYQFDWDAEGSHDYSSWYGPYNSGESCCKPHSWDSAGTYCVKAKSKAPCGHTSSWSNPYYIVIGEVQENNPPDTPNINGPASGKAGTEYDYTFVTTDPNGDDVYYYIEWGDDQLEEWIGPYGSGEEATVSHTWIEEGTYNMRAKAKDVHDAESDWGTLEVTMPVNHQTTGLPPPIPTVTGPTEGDVEVEYTFCAVATFGCSNVDYQFDWDAEGSHDYSSWYGPYNSGESCCKPHSWDSAGTYCVKAKSKAPCGHTSSWSDCHYIVITGESAYPDLDCDGSLGWTDVKPSDTVTGSFTVENIGDSGSKLDWEIAEEPNWGTWTFTPKEGNDLTPEDGSITVQVSVIVPDEQNQEFSGEVKMVNKDDSSDYCIIPVSLTTPKNKAFSLLLEFSEKLIDQFPLLEHVFHHFISLAR